MSNCRVLGAEREPRQWKSDLSAADKGMNPRKPVHEASDCAEHTRQAHRKGVAHDCWTAVTSEFAAEAFGIRRWSGRVPSRNGADAYHLIEAGAHHSVAGAQHFTGVTGLTN